FTPAQRPAAETMYAEYAREFDDGWKMYNDGLQWLWSTTGSNWSGGEPTKAFSDRSRRENHAIDEQWQRGARRLETQYFDRLASIAIGQEEAIESLQRKHRRE